MCSWLLAQTPPAGGNWDSHYAIHYNGTLNPGIWCGDLGLQQVHFPDRLTNQVSALWTNGLETSSQFWRTENYWTTLCCFSLLTTGTHRLFTLPVSVQIQHAVILAQQFASS